MEPWKSSVAGIVANLASLVFHPLENVKIRFQANDLAKNNPIPAYRGISDALKRIAYEEGFFSLYRGVIINMIAGSLANSVFFYVYSDGKKRYDYDPRYPYSFKTIMISMRAGLVSMFVTAPLWTVKTRMVLYREQFHLSNSVIVQRVVKDMWSQEGVRGFYHGFVPSIFMSSYGVIQMFCYENINNVLGYNQHHSAQKDMWIPFLSGGLSKCLASVTLLPLNVVRMRLQMKKYTAD